MSQLIVETKGMEDIQKKIERVKREKEKNLITYLPKIKGFIEWYYYYDDKDWLLMPNYINEDDDNRDLFIAVVADVYKDIITFVEDPNYEPIEGFDVSRIDYDILAIQMTEYIMALDMTKKAKDIIKNKVREQRTYENDYHVIDFIYARIEKREVNDSTEDLHSKGRNDLFNLHLYCHMNNKDLGGEYITRFTISYRYAVDGPEMEFVKRFYKRFNDDSINPIQLDNDQLLWLLNIPLYKKDNFLEDILIREYDLSHFSPCSKYKHREDILNHVFNKIDDLIDHTLSYITVKQLIKNIVADEMLYKRKPEKVKKPKPLSKYELNYQYNKPKKIEDTPKYSTYSDGANKYRVEKQRNMRDICTEKYRKEYLENFLCLNTVVVDSLGVTDDKFKIASYKVTFRLKDKIWHKTYDKLYKKYKKDITRTIKDFIAVDSRFYQSMYNINTMSDPGKNMKLDCFIENRKKYVTKAEFVVTFQEYPSLILGEYKRAMYGELGYQEDVSRINNYIRDLGLYDYDM